jgi:hypothetical protein
LPAERRFPPVATIRPAMRCSHRNRAAIAEDGEAREGSLLRAPSASRKVTAGEPPRYYAGRSSTARKHAPQHLTPVYIAI